MRSTVPDRHRCRFRNPTKDGGRCLGEIVPGTPWCLKHLTQASLARLAGQDGSGDRRAAERLIKASWMAEWRVAGLLAMGRRYR